MKAWLGLALLPLIALAMVTTGLPAFIVLIGAAGLGGLIIAFSGDAALIGALPNRLVALLDNDLLQALPLFVLMGILIDHLPIGESLFRAACGSAGRRAAAPRVAALAVGALLAPMNGSVGASVAMLSRNVRPRLEHMGVAPAQRTALIAAAATLGVVIPPSLVLIFLGDAMMSAHILASSIAHRSDRIVNTQDIFRAALIPAAMVFILWLVIAALSASTKTPTASEPPRATGRDKTLAAITVVSIVFLLGGVASGFFYAVEAAATGCVALLTVGLASRALAWRSLPDVMHETLALCGALFALLVAATTLTLALRLLGTDLLLTSAIQNFPGGETSALCLMLALIGLAALVLDAFEIIFVLIPIIMPGVLIRVADAPWVAAVTVLALQASFLLPPFGFAVLMARSRESEAIPARELIRALAPYLAVQMFVIALTLALPQLAHVLDPPALERPQAPPANMHFDVPAPAPPAPFEGGAR